MNSMKKNVLILLFLLTSFSCVSAKKFVKRWIIIRDTENKIVFIDTTSIRESDGQLSLWSLVKYKQPKEFVMYQGKVSKVKSHILFDTEKNRYTVIGSLFFDKRARIIGESSTPTISGKQKIISSPVIPGSDQQILLNKAKEYVITGKIVKEVPENIHDEKPKPFLVKKYSEPEKVVKDTVINPFGDVPYQTILTEDSSIIGNSIGSELRQELIKPESEDSTSVITDSVFATKKESAADSIGNYVGEQLKNMLQSEEDSSTTKYLPELPVEAQSNVDTNSAEIPVVTEDNLDIESNPNQIEKQSQRKSFENGTIKPDNASYNSDVEVQVSKKIWSDGNLFVIQLSSWRSKTKAESIVNKIKISDIEGISAFVFGKYIPKKKRKYYRVRIGYFTSLSEAKSYSKTLK